MDELKDVNARLARIESLLDNDPGTGRPGMYQMITQHQQVSLNHEKRLGKLETGRKFDRWLYTGGGAVGGGGFVYVLKIAIAKLNAFLF